MKPGLLFVDDDPNVLSGLRRTLAGQRHVWDLHFAEGGARALEMLGSLHVDVVISDMRMPGMDGAELLSRVREAHPHVMRIVLSGYADEATVSRAVPVAHQYLAKPCDAAQLVAVIDNLLAVGRGLGDARLARLLAGIESLPALPQSLRAVMQELERPEPSIKRVGQLIGHDVSLSASLLRVVNSSFYGFARVVTSPEQAVSLLGVRVVRSLALSAHLFTSLTSDRQAGFSLQGLWDHSVRVSSLAHAVARDAGLPVEACEQATVAGLLHDVGKLVSCVLLPQEYAQALALTRSEGVRLYDAEQRALGFTHAAVGGFLMGLWGVPVPVTQAIRHHHAPAGTETTPGVITVVHVANVLEHRAVIYNTGYSLPELDAEHLGALGLAGAVPRWEALAATLIPGDTHAATQDSHR